MMRRASAAIIVVSLVAGLLLGIVLGQFLPIPHNPQRVRVTGNTSAFGYPVVKVLFLSQKVSCLKNPIVSGCIVGANVSTQGTYSVLLENNQGYDVQLNFNETPPPELWGCDTGVIFLSSRSAVSYDATCIPSSEMLAS